MVTTRVPMHDGDVVIRPDGAEVHRIVGALTAETFLDGIPIGAASLRPDGAIEAVTDAVGRTTTVEPDGLRRPWLRTSPVFNGVDASGNPAFHVPQTETTATLAGRPAETILPDGTGVRALLDPGGRVVGHETLAGEPLGAYDPPLPLALDAEPGAFRTAGHYDAEGDLTLEYLDGLGRTVGATFPDGSSISATFDAQGAVQTETDATGRTTTHWRMWLQDGHRLRTTTYGGATSLTWVDHAGRGLRTVDPDGVYLSWIYDEWGRPVQRWLGGTDPWSLDPATFGELQVEWLWDEFDRIERECPGGASSGLVCTAYEYDHRGRVERLTRGAEVWDLTWSNAGELVTASLVAGPDSFSIVRSYDGAGHLVSVEVDGVIDGQTFYDVMGRPARFTPSVAGTGPTRWVYDDRGRLAELHEPGAVPTVYGYWPDGSLQRIDDGFGALDGWFEYDAAGRPVLEIDAAGLAVHYEYAGAELAAVREEDAGTGEVIGRTEYTYDAATGEVVATTRAIEAGCAGATPYLGSMAAVCAAGEFAVQELGWTAAGRRAYEIDAEGNTTQWSLDPFHNTGRWAGWASETLVESYQYDPFGRLARVDRGPGQYSLTTWDANSRPIDVLHVDGSETETEITQFDVLGQPIWQAVERNGALVEEVYTDYDAHGRVRQQGRVLDGLPTPFVAGDPTCEAGELCFRYDELGRTEEVTYPDQRGASFSYVDDRLQSVFEGAGPGGPRIYEVLGRDVRGRASHVWRSGDVDELLTRADDGQVTRREISMLNGVGPASPAPTYVEIELDYDVRGRLTSRASSTFGPASPYAPEAEDAAYTYNALGWLTSEIADGEAWLQSFDRAGNRLSRTNAASGEGFVATYGGDNRLETIDRGAGPFAFTYDDVGRRTNDEAGRALQYSPRGRLERVLDALGNDEIRYDYGVGGARVREQTAGDFREFTYGPGSWLPWVTTDSSGDHNEVIAGGEILATLDPVSHDVASRLTDARGNPWATTDLGGEPLWAGAWDAYGAASTSLGAPPQQEFKGMLGTLAAGVRYLSAGHRDYDPLTGTWLQPDPLGVDGDPAANRYRFANGDPVNASDPSGLCVDMTWRSVMTPAQHMTLLTGSPKGPQSAEFPTLEPVFELEHERRAKLGDITPSWARGRKDGPKKPKKKKKKKDKKKQRDAELTKRLHQVDRVIFDAAFTDRPEPLLFEDWRKERNRELLESPIVATAGTESLDTPAQPASTLDWSGADADAAALDDLRADPIPESTAPSVEDEPEPLPEPGRATPASVAGQYRDEGGGWRQDAMRSGPATHGQHIAAWIQDGAAGVGDHGLVSWNPINRGMALWGGQVLSAPFTAGDHLGTLSGVATSESVWDSMSQSQRTSVAASGVLDGVGIVTAPFAGGIGSVTDDAARGGLSVVDDLARTGGSPAKGAADPSYGRGADAGVTRFVEELEGAIEQAKRILATGGHAGTAWGKRHQIWLQQGGKPTAMSEGNAIHQIVEGVMRGTRDGRAPNRAFLDLERRGFAIKWNAQDLEGILNRNGNAIRPDIQLVSPTGAISKIDITTRKQAAKVEKYFGPVGSNPAVFNIFWR